MIINSEIKDEQTYFKMIEQCAALRENYAIPNSDIKHAAFLLKTIFLNSTSEVNIFTGKLFEGVYGDENLREAAKAFLRRSNAKLRIAYQESIDTDIIINGKFWKDILSDKERKGAVELWNANYTKSDLGNHFTIGDKSFFRFELHPDTRCAIGNFGDKESAEKLSNIFDKIISKAISVQSN